jgi:Protein of unknown function (DUF1631)
MRSCDYETRISTRLTIQSIIATAHLPRLHSTFKGRSRKGKPLRTAKDHRAIFNALHHNVTGELLRLIDGFYSNIEDGLFELAYRTEDDGQRRRCFDLMRELRFRRTALVKAFARNLDRYRPQWFEAEDAHEDIATGKELDDLIMRMAEKSSSHFSGVLNCIAERAEIATGRAFTGAHDLPISPQRIARAFVVSCRSLKFDHASIEIVQNLFSRFVLDSLGSIYGHCNLRLQDDGFATADELGIASGA